MSDTPLIKTLVDRIHILETRVATLEAELAHLKFLALPKNMSLEDQFRAMADHKDTQMTYSEMRERFG